MEEEVTVEELILQVREAQEKLSQSIQAFQRWVCHRKEGASDVVE